MTKKGPSHYEIDRLSTKAIFIGVMGLFFMLALILGIVWFLVQDWTHQRWPHRAPPASPSTAARWDSRTPQLQYNPGVQLDQLRLTENQRLHAVHWTDDSHTYATIPIEEAMKLLGDAGTKGQLGTLLPAPQPATPVDLQNQKSRALAPAPVNPPAASPTPVP